ncbi:MAG: ribonuclease III [Candidatus Sungbacteria bacterium]|nr:ribonuclease III [Candidatus Sungbacteria bacterium]
MKDLSLFEEKLSFVFENKDLLQQALTHRSFLNEHPSTRRGHNERLEFLGDAVLELAVTEDLYHRFPDKPEGDLTSFRAALVNAVMLSDVAVDLNVNDFLRLSRGESKDTGRARQYILANTFEAIVGAMYLDQGYDAAKKFILGVLAPRLDDVLSKKLYKDPKSLFQEEAQERLGITPTYEVVREWGPDHDKHFVVGVFLNDEMVSEGEGPSKQIAQEEAARNGLGAKGWG